MLILYISIILVVLGFIFLLTSVEKRKVAVTETKDTAANEYKSFSNTPSASSGSPVVETSDSYEGANTAPSSLDSSAVSDDSAVYEITLYRDESGVSLDTMHIDASNLKNLSREGRGIAEVSESAITVRIEKKLFRFDYYRLDRVGGGGECVVLSLKNGKGATIMISEDAAFFSRVDSQFLKFHG